MKTLAIIGSTGSIGGNALKIYNKNKNIFKLIYLITYKNLNKLKRQYKVYKPNKICLLNNKYLKNTNSKIFINFEKLLKKKKKIDYVISGLASYEAIDLNLKLTKLSRNLLIANKESIICGGRYFQKIAKKNKCNIIPIDSEHHCLDFFFKNSKFKIFDIDKVFLVASGGPFFRKKISYNEKISNVIKHPTWKMGKKITIDSSTLANKVLELFEAKILFNLPHNKLKILVEEKSNAHAIIKLKNKITIPIIHKPDMRVPITNSLNLNNKIDLSLDNLKLDFKIPSKKKFPLIKLGYQILKKYGDLGMIYFTVLNERLVKMYLNREIKYGDISKTLVKTFSKKNIINKSKMNLTTKKSIYNAISDAKKIKL